MVNTWSSGPQSTFHAQIDVCSTRIQVTHGGIEFHGSHRRVGELRQCAGELQHGRSSEGRHRGLERLLMLLLERRGEVPPRASQHRRPRRVVRRRTPPACEAARPAARVQEPLVASRSCAAMLRRRLRASRACELGFAAGECNRPRGQAPPAARGRSTRASAADRG